MKLVGLIFTFLLVSPTFATPHKHHLTFEAREEALEQKEVELDRRENALVKKELTKTTEHNDTMWRANKVGVLGFVGKSAGIVLVGYTPIDHFAVAAGLGLNIPQTGGVETIVSTGATYMFYDHAPFAIGPEFLIHMRATSSAGASAFSWVKLEPGLGFWYTPFPAPIAIGSAIQASITIEKGQNVSFNLDLPTVRVYYVFN